jgi:hypothetical protein
MNGSTQSDSSESNSPPVISGYWLLTVGYSAKPPAIGYSPQALPQGLPRAPAKANQPLSTTNHQPTE